MRVRISFLNKSQASEEDSQASSKDFFCKEKFLVIFSVPLDSL
jgi:hypothetical protein